MSTAFLGISPIKIGFWNYLKKKTDLQEHQKMKFLEISWTKYVQNLFAENYKTLIKGFKEVLSKLREIS